MFSRAANTTLLLVAATLIAVPAHAINSRTQIAPLGVAANDRFGYSVAGAGDVNGDGYADVIVGALQNDAGGSNAGQAYVFYGGPGADDVADWTLTGAAESDFFGVWVSGAGDVNGDGYADVIVGANGADAGGNNRGQAYVYFGGPGADTVVDWTLSGEADSDLFGSAVSGAGDVNGDGYDDVIVGAWNNNAGGGAAGRAYVYHGGPAPDAVADLTLTGEAASDQLGGSVSGAGDVNGDGFADVIVGARGNDAGGVGAGRAYVYYGGPAADIVADLTLTGEAANDVFGQSVSDAGDVNGDGFGDVVVGAYINAAGGGSAGRAYVYFGGPAADIVADLTLTGAAGEQFGYTVCGAGDVNGDGFADVFVGAWANDVGGVNAGRTYVFYGGAAADLVADLTFTGQSDGEELGRAIGCAGDANGDGFDDLIAGARFNNEGGVEAGKAFLFDQFRYILSSPNGAETWQVGSTQTISWLGKDLADVWLSTDGGGTYSELRTQVGGSASNELVLRVPHLPSKFAMVRLRPSDSILPGQDQSDSLFTIETSVALLTFTVAARPGGGAELAWNTAPTVGPQGIAGYRLYRSGAGQLAGDLGRQIGPSLITGSSYIDASGSQGSTYRLTAVNGLGEELELGRQMLAPSVPLAAWPMPHRGGVLNVSFAAASGLGGGSGHVDVSLYDAAGRHVRTLASGAFAPGFHTTSWDGRDGSGSRAPAGMYFLRLQTGGETRRMKVVVAE